MTSATRASSDGKSPANSGTARMNSCTSAGVAIPAT